MEGVRKSFDKRIILDRINLDIKKGEILGIIGSSGSGKTTLLHTIIGFINPEEGKVEMLVDDNKHALGHETFLEVHKARHKLSFNYGFASQVPSFYDNLTIKENLEYFGNLYGLSKHIVKTNTEILLHLMDLNTVKNLLSKNLSGGMERRLDIACALIHDPAILILDEPTADLDPVLRRHIYKLIKRINSKSTTIILASHHLSELEHMCDRIAILKNGRILACGTAEELKDRFGGVQQIKVQITAGNYSQFAKIVEEHINPEFIQQMHSHHDSLDLFTSKPGVVIKELLKIIDSQGFNLISLHVAKPSLDDIFISISTNKKVGSR